MTMTFVRQLRKEKEEEAGEKQEMKLNMPAGETHQHRKYARSKRSLLKQFSDLDHLYTRLCYFLLLLTLLLTTTTIQTTTATNAHHSAATALTSALEELTYAKNSDNADEVVRQPRTTNKQTTTQFTDADVVSVNKCCEKWEIYDDIYKCTQVNESDYYKPVFKTYSGDYFEPLSYKFTIGPPNCGSMQRWTVYDYIGSSDELILLSDGKLRHITKIEVQKSTTTNAHSFHDYADPEEDLKKENHYDYENGKYCIDKAISGKPGAQQRIMIYAEICLQKKDVKWTDTNFLIRKILDPIFHIIGLMLLLITAIVYFILPTLRDLVGNMVTTICICLMLSQAADIVRIFTEFSSHVSFVVADIIMYFSLLGAFFWLNSYAYYIWKMFRSRNVFLRVTDGRKYCYYSIYVWASTGVIAIMAVFAHFFLDTDSYRKPRNMDEQETIGWLGVAIFFAPIACTIILDLFFYVTTLKLINRRNVYGRIQHKLKSNFIMYALMLLVMSINWLFLILSWLQYDGLVYAHIFVNAFQAPLLFYVCVLRQKHITFLLKKSCCYNEPPSTNDWGDEMNYMNCNDY